MVEGDRVGVALSVDWGVGDWKFEIGVRQEQEKKGHKERDLVYVLELYT